MKTISANLFKNVGDKVLVIHCFHKCTALKIPETLLDPISSSNANFMFSDVLLLSTVKSIPRNLFSKFDESVLNGYFSPFSIEKYNKRDQLREFIDKNNITMNIGSKQVSLKALL